MTRTRLVFEGEDHFDFRQQAVAAFAGYRTAGGWSLQAALGAVLGGELEGDEMPGRFDIEPGFLAAVTGSRRWSFAGPWFVTGSASAALSATSTESGGASESLTAIDFRLGAIAGRSFGDHVSPYLLARGFGGPVMWTLAGEDVTGTDTRHFQLGAGLAVATAFGLSAVLDVAVLGEQSASLGVSWRL